MESTVGKHSVPDVFEDGDDIIQEAPFVPVAQDAEMRERVIESLVIDAQIQHLLVDLQDLFGQLQDVPAGLGQQDQSAISARRVQIRVQLVLRLVDGKQAIGETSLDLGEAVRWGDQHLQVGLRLESTQHGRSENDGEHRGDSEEENGVPANE